MERQICSCNDLKQMINDGYLWKNTETNNGWIKAIKLTNETLIFNLAQDYPEKHPTRNYNNLKYCPFCGKEIKL